MFEENVYNIFSKVAQSLGYSKVHGVILAALFLNKELSLKELAKKTKYSLSSISLSIDFLELLNLVEKKRKANKQVYIELKGDILVVLKDIFLAKILRSIEESKREIFKLKPKNEQEKEKLIRLRKEMDRFEKYIKELAKIRIPKR